MFKEYNEAMNVIKALEADNERRRQEIQFQATERQKTIIAHYQEEMRKAEIQHAKNVLKIKEVQNLIHGPATADTLDQLAKLCNQQ